MLTGNVELPWGKLCLGQNKASVGAAQKWWEEGVEQGGGAPSSFPLAHWGAQVALTVQEGHNLLGLQLLGHGCVVLDVEKENRHFLKEKGMEEKRVRRGEVHAVETGVERLSMQI